MKTSTILLIIATLGIAGFFLLKRKAEAEITPPEFPTPLPAEEMAPATCRERAIQAAMQQLGLPEEELTVRGLRAEDLGLTTWSMNLATADAWNTTVNTNVADSRFICLTGVSYSGTSAESVRVTAAGRRVAWFSIERVPGITETHHIDITPILIEQNQPIRIEVYASAVSATDNVILEGTTVEKRGMLLA